MIRSYQEITHSTPPLGGFPSEYRHPLWDGKTRMVSLPDGEKIYFYSFWRDPRTWQTDGRTDGQTDTAWQQRPRRGKNEHHHLNSLLFLVHFRFSFRWTCAKNIYMWSHATCQHTSLELRVTLNSLIHGSPFYVVMYSSYNLLKQLGFWPTL